MSRGRPLSAGFTKKKKKKTFSALKILEALISKQNDKNGGLEDKQTKQKLIFKQCLKYVSLITLVVKPTLNSFESTINSVSKANGLIKQTLK